MNKIRVLIGGLGDDAHSVGINLLKYHLLNSNFQVTFLGIQNTLDDFFNVAAEHEIIFISSVNGHSELYLNQFEMKLDAFKKKHTCPKIWYIGGNLSISKSDDIIIKFYLRKGFTRVFPKPVLFERILVDLKKDIQLNNIKEHKIIITKSNVSQIVEGDVIDEKYTQFLFEQERKQVLKSYHNGKDVNDIIACKNLHQAKNLAKVLWENKLFGKHPLIQPRTGVADLGKQILLFEELVKHNVSILSVQLDAATRRNLHEVAENGVRESIITGKSSLNGFPIPVHGIKGVKRIIEKFDFPFQIRGGAPDHRLTYEIGIAGGSTGVEGSFLCYLLPYDKLTTLSKSFFNWIYVDTLAAYYSKYDILINREFFGPLTSTLIEPSLSIVVNIIEAILSAKQGVRSISVGYAEQGNREQDIAAMAVLVEQTELYLAKYGFPNCQVTSVFHQYMAAFPTNETKAEELIVESSITASMAKATKIMTKTPCESLKIPNIEDNVRGIKLTSKGFNLVQTKFFNKDEINKEIDLLRIEVNCLMHAIELLGKGNIFQGAIFAFHKGIIDLPFSPNIFNKGESITFRDINGAIRYASLENLPFPEKIKNFHENALYKRKLYERESNIAKIVEYDIFRVCNNDYAKWPLSNRSLN